MKFDSRMYTTNKYAENRYTAGGLVNKYDIKARRSYCGQFFCTRGTIVSKRRSFVEIGNNLVTIRYHG